MKLTGSELFCVIECLLKRREYSVNILKLLEELRNWDLISQGVYNRHVRSLDPHKKRESIIQILGDVGFVIFMFLLEAEGYQYIADELRTKRYSLLYKHPARSEIPYSKRTLEFYRSIKTQIDNGVYVNPKETLQEFIRVLDLRIVRSNQSQYESQYAMEQKVAVTALLVTQGMSCEATVSFLDSALKMETNGTNNTSMQIFCTSRKALLEVIAGNKEKAEELITQTEVLCRSYVPCFAVTMALYDMVYIWWQKYIRHPTKENYEQLLTAGDTAFQSVQDFEPHGRNTWQRICLLDMALALLFISSHLEAPRTLNIASNTMVAKHILKEVSKRSDGIETRRKMIFFLCQAVVYKDENTVLADSYAKLAIEAADEGGCFGDKERKNMQQLLSENTSTKTPV